MSALVRMSLLKSAHKAVEACEKNVYEAAATLPSDMQEDFINGYLEEAGLLAGQSQKVGYARTPKAHKPGAPKQGTYVRECQRAYGRVGLD